MTTEPVEVAQLPTDDDDTILRLEDVGKHFEGVVALAGVSLSVRPGRILGLVGNNGAGKSTLVRILAGVQPPDAGQLFWKGEPVNLKSPRQAGGLGISTVYQELALADDLDASANIFLNNELRRGIWPFQFNRNARMSEESKKIVEDLSVDLPVSGTDVRRMSGGQRQAVAIARALLGGSELMLLDEPTAALGVQESAHVERLILRLRERGVGVVLVSHNVEQLLRLCDELCVLRRGRMIGVYRNESLTTSQIVSLIVGEANALAK